MGDKGKTEERARARDTARASREGKDWMEG
jgi:hypothetical protein